MITPVNKAPASEGERDNQGSCEETSQGLPCNTATADIAQQSWQLAVGREPNDTPCSQQAAVVACPAIQKQQQQPFVLDPRYRLGDNTAGFCPQPYIQRSTNYWGTTAIPSTTPILTQLPTYLNATRGISLIGAGECAGLQRPAMGLVQQVVDCFKEATKKEMLPSEVYVEMEKAYPYYKHITGQRRKSWMSSVRHALTTPRFKSRKAKPEDGEMNRRGCLWSLNENFDEKSMTTPRRQYRRRSSPGASRRKQRLVGKIRNDYSTPSLFQTNRNSSILYQQAQQPQAQSQFSYRFPFLDASPMQSTFSPGPTAQVHAGGSNMYYQPYRSPAVGYVVAGQKLPMQQQAIQPLSIGQWNLSGFSQCNQNSAAYFGGNNATFNTNQNCVSAMNQNNNATNTTPKTPAQAPNNQPTPISIQTASDQTQQQMCGQGQQTNAGTPDTDQGEMESEVHAEIKKELRNLVYESLAISNDDSLGVETTTTHTLQNNGQPLQVNRSPTWAKQRPPHHAQGGFHNYAWDPLSHQSQGFQGNETAQSVACSQELEDPKHDELVTIDATVIEDLDRPVVVHASISNQGLDEESSTSN